MNPDEDFPVVEPDPQDWPEETEDAPIVTGLENDEHTERADNDEDEE